MAVVGSGGVYVIDGRAMTYTSAADNDGAVASIYGMVVHVLSDRDVFDLQAREPRAVHKRNGKTVKNRAR